MSFFEELKRRNVVRVGIAYVIASWLLLQLTEVLMELLDLPDVAGRFIILLLVIGFVPAVIFAWAFEMTPEGIKREKDVDRSQSITKTTGRKLDRSIIVILVLALGYFAWDKFSAPVQPEAPAVADQQEIEKSIAVLPFVNMSADEDNEYFSDGLSEELLNLLAKVDGLKVAARTSSFKFKNSEADIAEIGEKLNVATILEGSVRKSGNQARITAQLIKVDDGFHLWSETYDRDLNNIFAVQDEIATAIVDALKLPLLGHDAQPLSTASTSNFAAYDLYLLGRHHARDYSELGFSRAIEYYQGALEIDPSFAPAYSGLADGYIFLSDFGDMPRGEALQLAQAAAEEALSLNPGLPEAHTSMGLLLNNLGQAAKAEIHFQKALEVNPNLVNALLWYRNSLTSLFRLSEATVLAERALGLDPLSSPVRRTYVHQMITTGRWDEAEKEIQAMIAARPDDPTPYEIWGDLFRDKGEPHNAIPMYRNAHRLRPGDIYMAAQNTLASLKLDDQDMVSHWLAEARNRGTNGRWTRFAETQVMYAKGEHSALLKQVNHALEAQAAQPSLLGWRGAALMHLGQYDKAETAFRNALRASGYTEGDSLSTSQNFVAATQLANVLDIRGQTGERDTLLNQASANLAEIQQTEQPTQSISVMAAFIASIRGDLPAVLMNLQQAVELGFRAHWELLQNPIFMRWREHPDFIAFHADMLEAAAVMRREYLANNPPATGVASQ